jgi:hypothetical protein
MKLQLLHGNTKNADWWSEMKKTNHNTHHPENSPTNRCGMMDTDDEAAGRLRSTDERICPSGGGIGRIQNRFGVGVRSFSQNRSVRND